MSTEFGNLYATLNYDKNNDLREVFATLGKAGSTVHADIEAMCRLISLCLREGVDPREVASQIKDIKAGTPVIHNGSFIYSIADALGKIIFNSLGENHKDFSHDFAERCPDCHDKVIYAEGCETCLSCGWSKCM